MEPTLRVARKGINRFGARKYAEIESGRDPSVKYIVVKIRKRGTNNYQYRCTCPDYMYRNRACKHIKKFKSMENGRNTPLVS